MPTLIRHRSGIFYIVYSAKGRRLWRSTRTRNSKEAYRIFLESPLDSKPDSVLLLHSQIDEYLSYVKTNFSPRTHEAYSLVLKHLTKFLGDLEVGKITGLMLERYKAERVKHVRPATINLEIRAIRTFLGRLKKWNIIQEDPSKDIRELRIPEEPPVYLTQGELDQLISGISDRWLRQIVLFAAMTGLRLGEILNLSWEDVSFLDRTLTIRSRENFRVKAGKMRTIPFNKTAENLLKEIGPGEGLVFRGKRGGKANGNFVSEQFRYVIRKMGFNRRIHFHSLRHTFASLLVKEGVSLYHVQRLLGHSSPSVTEMYAHLAGSELLPSVDRLSCISFTGGAEESQRERESKGGGTE